MDVEEICKRVKETYKSFSSYQDSVPISQRSFGCVGGAQNLADVFRIIGNKTEEQKWLNKRFEKSPDHGPSESLTPRAANQSYQPCDAELFLLPFTTTVLLVLFGLVLSETWALSRLAERLRKQLSEANDLDTIRHLVNQLTTLELYRNDFDKADYYSNQLLQISNALPKQSETNAIKRPNHAQKIFLRLKDRARMPWVL
jgi:hypothetical protein